MNEGIQRPDSLSEERGRAEQEIRAIRQQIESMGANDYEPGALERIIEALHSGALTPREALAAAVAIREGKQDYH